MSLIKECIVCGNRVSFRKMSHGKYVCFDVKTNNRHIHSKAEIDKARKKNGKDQKTCTLKNLIPSLIEKQISIFCLL